MIQRPDIQHACESCGAAVGIDETECPRCNAYAALLALNKVTRDLLAVARRQLADGDAAEAVFGGLGGPRAGTQARGPTPTGLTGQWTPLKAAVDADYATCCADRAALRAALRLFVDRDLQFFDGRAKIEVSRADVLRARDLLAVQVPA